MPKATGHQTDDIALNTYLKTGKLFQAIQSKKENIF